MPLYLKYQGFNYVDVYRGAYSDANSLPQLATTGASSVALTPDYGIDVANSTIYAAGDGTDTLANLATAIGQAAANGMTAFVRPLIDFFYDQASTSVPGVYYVGNYNDPRNVPDGVTPATVPAGATQVAFRGLLQPGDLDLSKFGASYTAMIVAEAQQAEAAGAKLFAIGTELDSLATSTDPEVMAAWTNIIAQVRAVFSGKLTYSANWADAEKITFWDKLDIVSIDGYVPLSNVVPTSAAQNPALADLVKGWTQPSNVTVDDTTVGAMFGGLSAVDFYNTLAQRSIDKQLIFSEIGYPNDTGAARDPAGNATTGVADPSLQARLYQAFFAAWGQAQATAAANGGLVNGVPFALVGAYFWNWYPDATTVGTDSFALAGTASIGAIRSGFAPPSTVSIATLRQSYEAIAAIKGGFQIVDTAATVGANIDALAAFGGALTKITLTDGGTPTLAISYAQAKADADVLRKIVGSYTLSIAPDLLTNDSTPALTGVTEAGANVALYDGTKLVGTAKADAAGVYAITTALLADGTHKLAVRVTDAAGHAGVARAYRTVLIDTKAPLAPAAPVLTAASDTGRAANDGITADATPTLSGKAEAGATVTLYDTNGTTVLGTAVASAAGAYTITAADLADGSHALKVRATDKAGNASALSPGRTIMVDTRPPATPGAPTLTVASDTGASSSDGITRDNTPTLTGTAEAGAMVTLYDGTRVLGSALAQATGTYTITALTLANGTHDLTVTATDKAGNASAASAPKSDVIDTRAPAPTITSSGGTVRGAAQTIIGQGEAGSTVTLTDNGRAIGAAVTVADDGSWLQKIMFATTGSHSLVATDIDAAGNVGKSAAVAFRYTPASAAVASLHLSLQAAALAPSSPTVAPNASTGAEEHPLAVPNKG